MKSVKEANKIDAVAEAGDCVNIEVQERPNGLMLYVHVNGETILRIGQLQQEVEFQRVGHFTQATDSELVKAYEQGVKDAKASKTAWPEGEELPDGKKLGWDQQA